jgi:hypothetical protein
LKARTWSRSRIARAVVGKLFDLDRVDLDDDNVLAVRSLEQGQDRRVGGVTAVPIVLAVDRHGMEQLRQAGRGQYRLGRDLMRAEDPDLSAAHIPGAHEPLHRRIPAQALEVHRLGQDSVDLR